MLGEPQALDLTASRRLQLAAESSNTVGLVLSRASVATVAVTRWRVATAASGGPLAADSRDFGLARARWQVELLRCRGAVAPAEDGFGSWWVEEGNAPAGARATAERLPDERMEDVARIVRRSPVPKGIPRVIDFPGASADRKTTETLPERRSA